MNGTTDTTDESTVGKRPENSINRPILIVFSDVDGTLVHYPETSFHSTNNNTDASMFLKLPPSRTGLQGILSIATLRKCQQLRRQGIKLVLISGMRTSTMMQRLPFLPKADAYCCENGGRIFYPMPVVDHHQHPASLKRRRRQVVTLVHVSNVSDTNGNTIIDASDESDTVESPFRLVEDGHWRSMLEHVDAAGPDGYQGEAGEEEENDDNSTIIPLEHRQGLLWEFAKTLVAQGFVLDWQGYATCFRVNRKQQQPSNQQSKDISDQMFQSLASGDIACPPGLIRSTNLGHIDFSPDCSGKRNW
jgi:hypothetical protein